MNDDMKQEKIRLLEKQVEIMFKHLDRFVIKWGTFTFLAVSFGMVCILRFNVHPQWAVPFAILFSGLLTRVLIEILDIRNAFNINEN